MAGADSCKRVHPTLPIRVGYLLTHGPFGLTLVSVLFTMANHHCCFRHSVGSIYRGQKICHLFLLHTPPRTHRMRKTLRNESWVVSMGGSYLQIWTYEFFSEMDVTYVSLLQQETTYLK